MKTVIALVALIGLVGILAFSFGLEKSPLTVPTSPTAAAAPATPPDARAICIRECQAAVTSGNLAQAQKTLLAFSEHASEADLQYIFNTQPELRGLVAMENSGDKNQTTDFSEWQPLSANYRTGPLQQSTPLAQSSRPKEADQNAEVNNQPVYSNRPSSSFGMGLMQGYGTVISVGGRGH